MSKLIEALQIFLKYGDIEHPTHCEHDMLHVMVDPDIVSDVDNATLYELGFFVHEEGFASYKYGSA